MLRVYNENRAMPIYYAYQIDTVFISDFLDYILIDREASPRTRNNYKGCIATFCNWMIEKGYITANPCDAIKKLTTEPKYRLRLMTWQSSKPILKRRTPISCCCACSPIIPLSVLMRFHT